MISILVVSHTATHETLNSTFAHVAAFAVLRTGLGRSHPLVSKLNDSLVRGRAGTLISSRAKGRIEVEGKANDKRAAICIDWFDRFSASPRTISG